jgi:NAD-dependent dihydropyrimidine dehydrogenase PreA subunit
MDKNDLQECITECESALTHLNHALTKAHAGSKQKMQHAAKDLEECIAECRGLL